MNEEKLYRWVKLIEEKRNELAQLNKWVAIRWPADYLQTPSIDFVYNGSFLMGPSNLEVEYLEEIPIPTDLQKFIEDEAEKYSDDILNVRYSHDERECRNVGEDFKAGANLIVPLLEQAVMKYKEGELKGIIEQTGGVDSEYIVTTISSVESDGGDW